MPVYLNFIPLAYSLGWKLFRTSYQARIHTGFHRFTEIGQIFIRNIFLIIIELSKLKSGKWSGQMFSFSNFWEFDAPSMNQKPGKGNFRELVSKKIPGGACSRAPLEACSLGPSFRKSVSIYPRSAPAYSEEKALGTRLATFPSRSAPPRWLFLCFPPQTCKAGEERWYFIWY